MSERTMKYKLFEMVKINSMNPLMKKNTLNMKKNKKST